LNIVFMGTPDFALPALRALIEGGYSIAAVVTQPDRPKGRKKVFTPPPVKLEAEAHGIPVLQPEKLRDAAAVEQLSRYAPDLIITAAYGQILPKSVLTMPRLGCINVHGSLLPKYRGAAPIQYAIMDGESETGVTIMYMEEGLDTGDMISSVRVPIDDADDTGSMFDKLSVAGAKLLMDTLPALIAGTATAVPQLEQEATYARMLKREHERIDWAQPALTVYNQIRAFRPWIGAFTTLSGDVLKIWRADKPSGSEAGIHESAQLPGMITQISPHSFEVACGSGSLTVTEVQPAGKTAMPVSEFLRSGRLQAGARLGEEATT
jgi:methionyl-tRNA formyltransferase